MTVRTYHPRISVKLVKNIRRDKIDGEHNTNSDRYKAFRGMDLTGWLGDAGGVRVTQGVRDSAGGFAIALADKAHPKFLESLYALIEPMDIIEIRMSHEPWRPDANGESGPRLVMRGFVSSVRRSISIGADGKPQRVVNIMGHDYGKFLQTLVIKYLNNSVVGDNILNVFALFTKYGIDAKAMSAREFVGHIADKVLTPYLAEAVSRIEPAGLFEVPKAIVADVSIEGTVNALGVQSFQGGPLRQMLSQFLDVGAFNEMFIEDRPDSVALVVRPAPFETAAGQRVQPGPAVAELTVDAADVVSMETGRNDSGVANYFWVSSRRLAMMSEVSAKLTAQAGSVESYLLKDYPNSEAKVYGFRTMEVETMLGDPLDTMGDGEPRDVLQKSRQAGLTWLTQRRETLRDINKDNVVFESGSIRLRGNEAIKAGMYLTVQQRDFASRYYVTQVSHEFMPFQGFFTTVQVERGTGFIERSQRGADRNAYLAEMGRGPG